MFILSVMFVCLLLLESSSSRVETKLTVNTVEITSNHRTTGHTAYYSTVYYTRTKSDSERNEKRMISSVLIKKREALLI